MIEAPGAAENTTNTSGVIIKSTGTANTLAVSGS